MPISDFISSMAERFRQGPFGAAREEDEPNLYNGGTSGYHPIDGKARRPRKAAQRMQQPAAPQQPYAAPMGYPGNGQPTGYQMGYPGNGQPTGFQAGYPGNGQPTGFQAGYPGNGQPTGFQAGYPGNGQPTGYQQQTAAPQIGSGYQGAFQGQRQATSAFQQNYQQNWPQREDAPYQPKFGQRQQAQDDQRNRRFGRDAEQPQAQQTPQAAPGGNIAYMPNLYVDESGMGYRHVERLTQPMSASTCYRLIEFMRNGESVIVNTELILDERENQRCLDLLYGAAFTMNCTFTRISAKSIYLIAPRTVSVISYESIRQMNEQDAALRWPGAEEEAVASTRRAPAARGFFSGFRAAQ